MIRLAQILFVIAVLVPASHAAIADEPNVSGEMQTWSVTFGDGAAILHASAPTDVKFIQGTIAVLQEAGVEEIALKAARTPRPSKERPSLIITLLNNEAELSASPEIEVKHVTAIISMLAKNDVHKVKFAVPKK